MDYLNQKMDEIRDNGKVIGLERIAIMAALNIAHELLTTKVGGGFDMAELKRRMTKHGDNCSIRRCAIRASCSEYPLRCSC